MFSLQTGDAPICDPKAFYGCKLRAQQSYVRENAAADCNCRRQCRRLHYRPTISQAMLSHAAAEFIHRITENNTESIEQTINNHVLVEVRRLCLFCSQRVLTALFRA